MFKNVCDKVPHAVLDPKGDSIVKHAVIAGPARNGKGKGITKDAIAPTAPIAPLRGPAAADGVDWIEKYLDENAKTDSKLLKALKKRVHSRGYEREKLFLRNSGLTPQQINERAGIAGCAAKKRWMLRLGVS